MGVVSSVANDVTMRMGAASAVSTVGTRWHNENDITMTIAGLWRYGDWRHVATGCTAVVKLKTKIITELVTIESQTLYSGKLCYTFSMYI